MATIRDVAQAAGVSVATVSHVINESRYVAPETREKVQTAIEQLRYRRDGVARSLRRSKTGTIGVMISDITNPYFSDFVRGVEDKVYSIKNPYNFILCNTEEDSVKERLYLDVLLEKRVDGIIISPAGGNADYLRDLTGGSLPIVCVDRTLAGVACDSVVVNNRETARAMATHLIRLGHRRIVLFRATLHADSIQHRVEGFCDALTDAGLAIAPGDIVDSASDIDEAYRIAFDLLRSGPLPDAVFTTNNFMTLGVMKALTDLGLRCPQDLAVAGFDDFPWATAFRPRLTVVSQPSYLIGQEAVNLLFDRMSKRRTGPPVKLTLNAHLVIRESCGSVSTENAERPRDLVMAGHILRTVSPAQG